MSIVKKCLVISKCSECLHSKVSDFSNPRLSCLHPNLADEHIVKSVVMRVKTIPWWCPLPDYKD